MRSSAEMAESDDREVWHSTLQGHIESLEVLFQRYYNDLFYYALKLCGNKQEAEDYIHETFLHIWERRKYLDEVEYVKSYLYRALRNFILMEKRKSGQTRQRHKNVHKLPEMQFSPEEIIIEKEQKHQQEVTLQRALNALPRRQREVIFLKFYNGLTYEEIQDLLSLNYQTVRNYVYEGLRLLEGKLNRPMMGFLMAAFIHLTVTLLVLLVG